MAIITLTSGIDDVLVEAPLQSFLNGSSISLAGTIIDGLGGLDTLTIDTSIIVGAYSIGMTPDRTIVLTTSAGSAAFTNFEQLMIEGVAYALGSANADTLGGTDGNDGFLWGYEGNDTINGGLGADSMVGGLGDDTYYVDNSGDRIAEMTGEGNDTIISKVTFSMVDPAGGQDTAAAFVENLTLTGFTSINATGNALDNYLIGNNASNVLDGGAGIDTLAGGLGADAYFVDRATDIILEKPGEGIDVVTASVSYALAANVDNLILTGTAKTATGNYLANIITGNDVNNVIDGGLGIDTMRGGKGDDIYYVSQTADQVYELTGQGNDTVRSGVSYTLSLGVETLILTGAAAVNATGSSGANTIQGNGATNIIAGGLGRDILTGGAGADVFDFNTQIDSRSSSTARDLIMDFQHKIDHIDLSGIDANTMVGGNQTFTFLGGKGAAFTGATGQIHYLAAGANTLIEGDTNGDKRFDFQIELKGTVALSAADFVL